MLPLDSVGQPEFRQNDFPNGLNGLRKNLTFSFFHYIFPIGLGLSAFPQTRCKIAVSTEIHSDPVLFGPMRLDSLVRSNFALVPTGKVIATVAGD